MEGGPGASKKSPGAGWSRHAKLRGPGAQRWAGPRPRAWQPGGKKKGDPERSKWGLGFQKFPLVQWVESRWWGQQCRGPGDLWWPLSRLARGQVVREVGNWGTVACDGSGWVTELWWGLS